MKDWVESPWAQVIAMARQLLGKICPANWRFGGMIENVNPNEAEEELPNQSQGCPRG